MEVINVFADCMSSGFWKLNGPNIEEDYFKEVLTQQDLMLMKYWHEAWEFWIQDGKASNNYIDRWNSDGRYMCELWNAKQDKFQFNYIPEKTWL